VPNCRKYATNSQLFDGNLQNESRRFFVFLPSPPNCDQFLGFCQILLGEAEEIKYPRMGWIAVRHQGVAGSLSDFGESSCRSGRTVPIFRKYKANSRLFNENFRKSGAVIPLLRPIHPKSGRLPGACWTQGESVA
jgi:hypothetical protein